MYLRTSRRPDAPRRRTRLGLEALEARWTPAVFNVNTLADGFNIGPGLLSLRQAIQMADQTPGGNTINLKVAGTYNLTLLGPNEDADLTGDLDVLPSGGNLTIQNVSGGPAAVSGDGTDRVFDINPADSATTAPFAVKLVGLTVENGFASPGDGAGGSGGGIRDQGNASLELDSVTVTDNVATADGGGIAMENTVNVPWKLTINGSVISNNHAGDAGGGIDEDGRGTINVNPGSQITGNTCTNQGAGIWLDAIDGATANTTISGTIVSNNIAFTGTGGGVGNAGNGSVVLFASLVEYNFSGATGGGFGDEGNAGKLTVEGSTTFLNNASTGGGGGIQEGGPLTIIADSTIKGNVTQGDGGGVFLGNANDPAQLVPGNATAIFDTQITGNVGVNGGGVEDTDAVLNIVSSILNLNRAVGLNGGTDGNGGGLDAADGGQGTNVAGAININQTLFAGNVAGNNAIGDGGGINQAVGSLSINASEFVGNAAGNLGGGVDFAGSFLHLTGSTFFNNRAIAGGGGLEFQGTGTVGAATFSFLINDTFVVNLTGGVGGGIDDRGPGDLILLNDTITANSAGSGGGLALSGNGLLALENTVVALDAFSVPGGQGVDVFTATGSAVTDYGGNFVGTLAGSKGFGPTVLTGNPRIGVLLANGGPVVGTLAVHFGITTEAPLPGSPLVGAGLSQNAPSTDERGVTRPSNARPTIGAYQ